MAHVTDIRSSHADIPHRIADRMKSVVTRVHNYRLYRKTLAELGALTTRELDDLGIHRSMINRIAMEAAYNI